MSKTYETVQSDMWDGIAYKLYGTETALNKLLDANQQYAGIVVFPAGVELQVPEYIAPAISSLPPWRR